MKFVFGWIPIFDGKLLIWEKIMMDFHTFNNGIFNMCPVKNIDDITSRLVDIKTHGKENYM